MNQSKTTPAAAVGLCLLAGAPSWAVVVPDAAYVPGELIVAPHARQRQTVKNAVAQLGCSIVEEDEPSGLLRVEVARGMELVWMDRLAAQPGVRHVERTGRGRGGVMPDDTIFGSQWPFVNTGQAGGTADADVDADLAWDITTGSFDTVIAVLDTGIEAANPEFAGHIDPDGMDFVNTDSDPEDDHSHGTNVSGLITCNSNNAFATAGMAWASTILPIKVLDDANLGTTFDLIQGLNYAAGQADVDIINMSLINYPNSSALNDALQGARDAGKILMACAGNSGIGNADVSWPGGSPLTMSIGATDRNDVRAGFSGTGAALDFVAPGVSVHTVAWPAGGNAANVVSGCSFATPIASGIVALLLARADELGVELDHDTVRDLLAAGAEDQVGPGGEDTAGRDDFFGEGRLNARGALDALALLADCNMNGVVDSIDIAADPLLDVDMNGVLDDCDTRANDECLFSAIATIGDQIITTAGATASGTTEPCGTFETDVWYRLALGSEETVTISICDATWDASLALYTFVCPAADDLSLVCASGECVSGQPSLTTTIGPGLFRIRISGANGETGPATLSISTGGPPEPCPADCAPPGGNGLVNIDDLVAVVNAISTQDPGCDVAPDNGDGTFGNGVINFDDLIDVVNAFGDCP